MQLERDLVWYIFFFGEILHCNCFDHKNYGVWKLLGDYRENMHYLWQSAVRIVGFPCKYRVSQQFLQHFSIDSADLAAGTKQFPVPVVFLVKTCEVWFLSSYSVTCEQSISKDSSI